MIAVQKVTNVGFSLHDGLTKSEDELTPEQRRYAIRSAFSELSIVLQANRDVHRLVNVSQRQANDNHLKAKTNECH